MARTRASAGVALASLLLALTACGGSDSVGTADPTGTSGATEAGGTPTTSPAAALTGAQVRQAWKGVVAAGTGRSTVRIGEQPTDDRASVAALPRVDGEWSFRQHASSTVSTSETSEGTTTLSTRVIEDQGYVQALYDGSVFAPDCWMAPRHGGELVPHGRRGGGVRGGAPDGHRGR